MVIHVHNVVVVLNWLCGVIGSVSNHTLMCPQWVCPLKSYVPEVCKVYQTDRLLNIINYTFVTPNNKLERGGRV